MYSHSCKPSAGSVFEHRRAGVLCEANGGKTRTGSQQTKVVECESLIQEMRIRPYYSLTKLRLEPLLNLSTPVHHHSRRRQSNTGRPDICAWENYSVIYFVYKTCGPILRRALIAHGRCRDAELSLLHRVVKIEARDTYPECAGKIASPTFQ